VIDHLILWGRIISCAPVIGVGLAVWIDLTSGGEA